MKLPLAVQFLLTVAAAYYIVKSLGKEPFRYFEHDAAALFFLLPSLPPTPYTEDTKAAKNENALKDYVLTLCNGKHGNAVPTLSSNPYNV